jgi:hypothetical protein
LRTGSPCPRCFQPVPLEMVWSLARKNRFGVLAYSTGVVCPSCGARLRIVQRFSAAVLALLYILAAVAVGAAGRFGVPSAVALVPALLVLAFVKFGSGPLQRRLAVLKIREGNDTVDFPVERLKQELSGEAQRNREAELEGAADTIGSWVCRHCGEPTPSDCPACVNCGRLQSGMSA